MGTSFTKLNLENRPPILILSYFDSLVGPNPFKFHPENLKESFKAEILQNIASHMDVHRENDLFQICYGNEKINAINLIFSIHSEWARGMREICMVTLVDVGCHNLIDTYRPYLMHFTKLINKIDNGFKGFYVNNVSKLKIHPEIRDINEKINNLIYDFYDSLPKVMFGKQKMQLGIFGLHHSGKMTILNRIQKNKLHGKYAVIQNINIVEMVLRGTKFLIYSPPESLTPLDLIEICAKTDVIVFVIDGTDTEKFPRIQQLLFEMLNARSTQKTPIVILNNKIDKTECKKQPEIIHLLNLSKIKRDHWQIFDVSALSGQGLDLALDWIIREYLNLQKRIEDSAEAP
ncbi:MAG: ADP-ribosylation factor-like 1 [Promethearchaeota archaeon CR_4]|nr:MAG: ADP-ribosylation factor-like 1 [Candidatus Lokiarchaeota archaeon CR_4]